MALTVRKSDAQVLDTVRQIAPTLLIGLGGTGKEVLLRIRRRFFERFGEVGFPIMRYLWIDTDMRNVDLEGQQYDYLMDQVAFHAEEKLDAQVPGPTFVGFFRDPESHPNIFSWLDPGLRSYGQVIDGAGQKRQFGRLAFFLHHRRFRDRLLAMKNEVLDQRAADALVELSRRHQMDAPQVDRGRLDVIFVFSVAGGTGSGMFLDAAFYCRDLLTSYSPNLTGYLFLPTVFNPDVRSNAGGPIYANGYAALKELEHYSLAKDLLHRRDDSMPQTMRIESDHQFQVEWTRGETRSLTGPPFNTCYLLDNQSVGARQSLSPQDKRFLCDMVAEAVFLEFNEGSFAARKRSTRSNLEQFLLSKVDMDYQDRELQEVLFTDVFSCRFSSFGLTKLYIPADRIRRYSAYRLAGELIHSLLDSPPLPGDAAAQIKRHHLPPMGLEPDALVRALALNADNSDRLVQDEIADEIGKRAEEWKEALPEPASGQVRSYWDRLRAQLGQEGDPGARPGDHLARLRDANPETLARRLFGSYRPTADEAWGMLNEDPRHARDGQTAAGSIGRAVRGWLDDPRFRLPLARQYVEAVAAIFRDEVQTEWRQQADERRQRADALRESLERRLAMLDHEEDAGKLTASKKALLRRVRRDLTSWSEAVVQERVFLTAVELVERRLLPYLDRLRRVLEELERDLQAAKALLDERREAFTTERGHQIFLEVFNPALLEDAYELRTPDGFERVGAERLREFEREALGELSIAGVGDLPFVIASRSVKGLTERLEGLAFARFRDLRVRFDVLGEFRRIFSARGEQSLREWAREGTVWLPPGDAVRRHESLQETFMDLVFLGAPEAEKHDEARLLEVIRNTLTETPPRGGVQHLENASSDSVYVYSELAGISLPYLRHIEQYLNDAYLSERRTETAHIDYHEERFPQEIVLREFHDVRGYLEAYRLLLLGTISGILQSRRTSTGRLAWSFLDREKRNQPAELGPELIAVNTLQRKLELARRIDRLMTQGISELTPERQQELYAVLLANLSQEGSFPPRYRYSGNTSQLVRSHGRQILEREADRLERELQQSLQVDKSFLVDAAASRQLDEISVTVPWQEPTLRVLRLPIQVEAASSRAFG